MSTTLINRTQPPQIRPMKSLDLLNPEIQILDNQVELAFISGGNEEIVKIDVVMEHGVCHQHIPFLAHATAKMLAEGTKRLKSAEISELLDYYGAYYDAEVTADSSKISLVVLNKYAHELVPLFFELIFQVEFRDEEFKSFKNRLIQRLLIKQEESDFIASRNLYNLMFGDNHPMGKLFNADSIRAMKIDDLHHFHEGYLQHKIFVSVSGKFDKTIEYLIISQIDQISLNINLNTAEKPLFQSAEEKQRLISKEDASQTAIKIGLPFFNRTHSHYPEMKILTTILGGYFGSRLMQNIREEKGLTYGIEASLDPYQKGSVLSISTEVKAENWKEALTEIKNEVRNLSDGLVSSAELKLVRAYTEGAITRMFNGPFRSAREWNRLRVEGLDFKYYKDFLNKMNKMKPEKLREIAQNYLNADNLFIAIVGNTN